MGRQQTMMLDISTFPYQSNAFNVGQSAQFFPQYRSPAMQMPVQTPESIMSAPILSNQTAYSKKSISNFRRKLYQKQNDECD